MLFCNCIRAPNPNVLHSNACSEEGEKASQALRQALKDYNLKFSVILSDPDMAPFRAMPEFKQLQDEVSNHTFFVIAILNLEIPHL